MSIQLGKYRLVRRLGAGGMGEVWEAFDTVLERTVAVKLLHGAAAENTELVREATAAAKVSHPHAVAVYDAVEADGRWFLVMEYVAGKSAGARVAEAGKLPWEEATRIARDAAAGLAAVHAAGLIHRDVKPANILLTTDGVAKLADFGLARPVRSGLTTAGSTVVGTPHYMSPEQCWSEAADGRSDIYSLGATYFTLLTGRTPYEAATDMAVMYAHCNAEIPDPRDRMPEVPAACAAVIRRAMAKQPPDRYATAEALRAALDQVLSGSLIPTPAPTPILLPPPTIANPPPRRRMTRRALLAAVPASAAAVGLAAYLWSKAEQPTSPPVTINPVPPEVAWVRRWTCPTNVVNLVVSPDGTRVAMTLGGYGHDRTLDGVDVRGRDGKSLPGWPKAGPIPDGVAFSPDNRRLAVAYRQGGQVGVWNLTDDTLAVLDLNPDGFVPCCVAFSDDGAWLAVGSYSKTVHVGFWQAADDGRWQRKHDLAAAERLIWGLAFAPDSTLVVAGLADTAADPAGCAIRVYEAVQGTEVPGPAFRPTRTASGPAVAFSRKPKRLAVGSNGGTRVFDVPAWTPVGGEFPIRIDGKLRDPYAVALSVDGKWLVAAHDEGVWLWEVATGKRKPNIGGHVGQVAALAFTPDGKHLLTGGADTQVLVHDLAEVTR